MSKEPVGRAMAEHAEVLEAQARHNAALVPPGGLTPGLKSAPISLRSVASLRRLFTCEGAKACAWTLNVV